MSRFARDAWRWLAPLALDSLRPVGRRRSGESHLILAIADHFEPRAGDASEAVGRERVASWVGRYPEALGGFRDADGRPPRHTYFYPVEVYDSGHLDALSGLCREGYGEVEIHLHHDNDTAENLRMTLREASQTLAERHGLLGRRRDNGDVAYAFVHGNWALNNSRPDGRWCGVNDEVRVLAETGCYADFTYPSAPSPTQPSTFNRITHGTSRPDAPKGHDRGVPVGMGPAPEGSIMMIPGPLALNWKSRKWGVVPRVENACLQTSQPPSVGRLGMWLGAGVRVPSRPDWSFVKLHAHGGPERDREVLLGEPMVNFHRDLARLAEADPGFHVHYVTAREMYNLARAAESGWRGSVAEARDFAIVPGDGPFAVARPVGAGEGRR